MDTYSVVYSPAARDDLFGVYTYIATELLEPEIAAKQTVRIRNAIRKLEQLPARHAGGTQLLPFRQLPTGVLPAALPVERESRDRSVADRHVADAAVPGPIVHIDPVREPVPAINRRRLGNPRTVRLRGGSGRQVPG